MHCELFLVAHALTQWNVDGRKQGHTDTPLNETGLRMARSLAQRLKYENIDAIYSSDLRRAYETITDLAEILGLPINKDIRLREGRWMDQEKKVNTKFFPIL